MPRLWLIVVAASTACGPMAVPNGGSDESTTLDGEVEAGTETHASLGGCTLPSSAVGSDGGVDHAGDCTPIEWTPIDEPALESGSWGSCEPMPESTVFENRLHVAAHHEAWCERIQSCSSSPEPCGPAPDLPRLGERIAYVHTSGSGCGLRVSIDEVLDCGDAIEVHYSLGPIGCDAFSYVWASAAIPCGPAPVVFIED
jgi:hypothetical protein